MSYSSSLLVHQHSDPRAIVIEPYRTVYLPIPKVACTSFKTTIAQVLGIEVVGNVHHTEFPSIKRGDLGKLVGFSSFAFVRNPWDRLLSCYADKIQRSDIKGYAKYPGLYPNMPFSEFVRVIADIPDVESNNHFKSQHLFICDDRREVQVDYIGRFESIDNDVQTLCKTFNIPNLVMPHLRKTEKGSLSDYYTSELADIAARRYEQDIAIFEYNFSD